MAGFEVIPEAQSARPYGPRWATLQPEPNRAKAKTKTKTKEEEEEEESTKT
jgi:hypothetical protein